MNLSAGQSSLFDKVHIVASIHGAVFGCLERSYAGGELGMFPKRRKTAVARMHFLCLADYPGLCLGALAEVGARTITAIPKREKE